MIFYKFLQVLFWLPGKIFLPTKKIGKENLIDGGYIFSCNHQSILDIAILILNFKRSQHFLGKTELFKSGKKSFFAKIGAISIDRENPQLSSIKRCIEVLKEDKILTVFPEGTRKNRFPLENFKSGISMFAIKSNKPIIPLWIEKKPKIFLYNTLHIGKPIYLEGLPEDKKEQLEFIDKKLLYAMKNLMFSNKKIRKNNKFLI